MTEIGNSELKNREIRNFSYVERLTVERKYHFLLVPIKCISVKTIGNVDSVVFVTTSSILMVSTTRSGTKVNC